MLRQVFVFCLIVSGFLVENSSADLVYNILPQDLIHESDSSPEEIYGGTITMVDNADSDGILTADEIIEVKVENSLHGSLWAYDAFDFLNVDAAFVGNHLVGDLSVQHTPTGEGFVDWGYGDLISISDYTMSSYASAPWESPYIIASRAVPEPSCGMLLVPALVWTLKRRRQKRG